MAVTASVELQASLVPLRLLFSTYLLFVEEAEEKMKRVASELGQAVDLGTDSKGCLYIGKEDRIICLDPQGRRVYLSKLEELEVINMFEQQDHEL